MVLGPEALAHAGPRRSGPDQSQTRQSVVVLYDGIIVHSTEDHGPGHVGLATEQPNGSSEEFQRGLA